MPADHWKVAVEPGKVAPLAGLIIIAGKGGEACERPETCEAPGAAVPGRRIAKGRRSRSPGKRRRL